MENVRFIIKCEREIFAFFVFLRDRRTPARNSQRKRIFLFCPRPSVADVCVTPFSRNSRTLCASSILASVTMQTLAVVCKYFRITEKIY